MWWAPVQTTEEVLADPQAWAGGGFVDVPDARRRGDDGEHARRLRRHAGRRRERCRPTSASTPTRSSPSSDAAPRRSPTSGPAASSRDRASCWRRGIPTALAATPRHPTWEPAGARRRGGSVIRRFAALALAVAVLAVVPVPASAAERARGRPGSADPPDPYFPQLGNRGYDVQHYDLDLAYDSADADLEGEATITAVATGPLRRFHLDLVGMRVESASVDGRAATVRAPRRRARRATGEADSAPARSFGCACATPGRPSRARSPGWACRTDGFARRTASSRSTSPTERARWFPAERPSHRQGLVHVHHRRARRSHRGGERHAVGTRGRRRAHDVELGRTLTDGVVPRAGGDR